MCDIELNLELRGLKNDRIMTNRFIDCQKREMLEQLKGEMGQDMMAVLNGKKCVELGKLESLKFRFRNFLRRFFRMF